MHDEMAEGALIFEPPSVASATIKAKCVSHIDDQVTGES